MKKLILFKFLLLITVSMYPQKKEYFYEDIFIKKYTKKYIKYEKKYKPKILKILSDSLKNDNINIDSIDIFILPTINYKKRTKRTKFVADTTKFFYFLNPQKLYFGEAYIFYKKRYIGSMNIRKSFKNPVLFFVRNLNMFLMDYFFYDKINVVKFTINNRSDLIFFIENNCIFYFDINEHKVYYNIEKLQIKPPLGIWYNKIKYVGAK